MSGLSEKEWEAARELLSCLAHDLNNFLSPLCLYGEVLEESLTDPVQKQKASAILRRSESMKELIASAQWIYKEDEKSEAFQAETFARRFAALTNSSFKANGVSTFWVLPKQATKIPGEALSGRFRLAIQIRRLAAEVPPSSTALILLNKPATPVFARVFSGEEAEAAAKRFRLEESAITALDDAAIESLVSSLAKCKPYDLSHAAD